MSVQNIMIPLETGRLGSEVGPSGVNLEQRRQAVRNKIDGFCKTAIEFQTLTLPRDPITTQDGISLLTVLKGRVLGGFAENGVRIVIQQNTGQLVHNPVVRFIMSPLFDSEADAISWAKNYRR